MARNVTNKADNVNLTQYMNQKTCVDYFQRLKMIATSMFEWKGLPDTVSERFLEETLFNNGCAVFCDDNIREINGQLTGGRGLIVSRVVPSGELNHYDESTKYRATATGFDREYLKNDCVFIRNNCDCIPTADTIQLFVSRLYECERSIDVNIKGVKTPTIIVCSEEQRLSMKNLIAKYDGNEPFIFGTKELDLKGITSIKNDVPFVADKLMSYKHELWNDCLSFLGINNTNESKKERLITDEVNANNEMIEICGSAMLKYRQLACKEFNEKYGYNISVDYRNKKEEILDEPADITEEDEGNENE